MGANEKALQEFDNVMQHSLCDGNIYAVIDSASLLWRLEVSRMWSVMFYLRTYVYAIQ